MADIPSEANKVYEEHVDKNRPASESTAQLIGGSVNYLLDQIPLLDGLKLTRITFLTTQTFTVPQDVTRIFLEGCGGGGGGGAGYRAGPPFFFGVTGAAGCGADKGFSSVSVVPNEIITVVIGQGGAGGAAGQDGSPGGDSSFKNVTFKGASGGYFQERFFGTSTPFPFWKPHDILGGGWRYIANGSDSGSTRGQDSRYGFICPTSSSPPFLNRAFAGGAGPYGNGAAGADVNIPLPAQNAAPNSGAGGGAGIGDTSPYASGSAGGSGRIVATFYSKF